MRTIVLTTAAAALLIAGCDRIPGTEANRIAKGEKVAADQLLDPSSAQFRKTVLRPGPKATDEKAEGPRWIVCGEINGKNRNGAYVGFTRFLADPDGTEAYLEPNTTTTQEEADRAALRCQRGAKGPIYSETDREIRLMQCEEASRLGGERLAVHEFNMTWEAMCPADGTPQPAASPPAPDKK